MHSEIYSVRYRPTSPLSPRLSTGHGALSPPSSRSKVNHSQQSARGFRLDLTSYQGLSPRSPAMSPHSAVHTPAATLYRGTQPSPMESPRLMREKQKELIARAQLSSKLAASPMAAKPDAPRLDPLDGPNGPVTPLALEEREPIDYFNISNAGRFSPAASPGVRSARTSTCLGKDEKTKKSNAGLFP